MVRNQVESLKDSNPLLGSINNELTISKLLGCLNLIPRF